MGWVRCTGLGCRRYVPDLYFMCFIILNTDWKCGQRRWLGVGYCTWRRSVSEDRGSGLLRRHRVEPRNKEQGKGQGTGKMGTIGKAGVKQTDIHRTCLRGGCWISSLQLARRLDRPIMILHRYVLAAPYHITVRG